jgi:hypothetical protein
MPQSRLLVVRRSDRCIGGLRGDELHVAAVDAVHAVGGVVGVVDPVTVVRLVGVVLRDAVRSAVESFRRVVRRIDWQPGIERRISIDRIVVAVGLRIDRWRCAGRTCTAALADAALHAECWQLGLGRRFCRNAERRPAG